MFGKRDENRSRDQGRGREVVELKEGAGEGTVAGTRTGSEALMRAMSVLGNAKSNSHRKTHRVEPGDTVRKFTCLTRGGLPSEGWGGVSRGHSSEEARGNPGRAKGRRDRARRDRRPTLRQEAGRSPKPEGRDNNGRHPRGLKGEAGWSSGRDLTSGGQVMPQAEGGQR